MRSSVPRWYVLSLSLPISLSHTHRHVGTLYLRIQLSKKLHFLPFMFLSVSLSLSLSLCGKSIKHHRLFIRVGTLSTSTWLSNSCTTYYLKLRTVKSMWTAFSKSSETSLVLLIDLIDNCNHYSSNIAKVVCIFTHSLIHAFKKIRAAHMLGAGR